MTPAIGWKPSETNISGWVHRYMLFFKSLLVVYCFSLLTACHIGMSHGIRAAERRCGAGGEGRILSRGYSQRNPIAFPRPVLSVLNLTGGWTVVVPG